MSVHFSPAATRAFDLFFLPWMRTRLHAILMTGLPSDLPADRPLLLAANHVSWWDGFVLRAVQRALRPSAPFHPVMTEAELRRFPYFRLLGAVGIDRESTSSILRAVRGLRRALERRPDSVVIYFPQGRMWPSHRRPLGFQRGVELFSRSLQPIVLPVALHLEALNHAAPSFFAAVGRPLQADAGFEQVEREVEEALDALLAFVAEHGEESERRWPGARGSLPALTRRGAAAP